MKHLIVHSLKSEYENTNTVETFNSEDEMRQRIMELFDKYKDNVHIEIAASIQREYEIKPVEVVKSITIVSKR
jgi:hypothetical protein